MKELMDVKEVEGNYLVLDWSDVREALSEENLDWFEQIIFAVRHNREVENGQRSAYDEFLDKKLQQHATYDRHCRNEQYFQPEYPRRYRQCGHKRDDDIRH